MQVGSAAATSCCGCDALPDPQVPNRNDESRASRARRNGGIIDVERSLQQFKAHRVQLQQAHTGHSSLHTLLGLR